ncbi:MAG: hypothetical protein OXB88_09540 [Bacteriovoracales bacterium]|nr:hypothetical protein [Bacteriovoracales bacterium]
MKKIIYIGKDINYWKELQKEFNHYFPQMMFLFEERDLAREESTTSLFLELVRHPPDILYVDFSVESERTLYLAELLQRENSLKHVPIIGLLNYLASDKGGVKALATGIPLVHIKSGELSNVSIQPICMVYPDEIAVPKFATAKTERTFIATEVFHIAYVAVDYLYLEGGSRFEEGQKIALDQDIFSEKILPYNVYEVRKVSSENLYYGDYFHCFEAKFLFVEGFEDEDEGESEDEEGEEGKESEGEEKESEQDLSEGDESGGGKELKEDELREKRLLKKKIEREKQMERNKIEEMYSIVSNRIKKWVAENASRKFWSEIKILVIDSDLQIYEEDPQRLKDIPCFLQAQTYLENPKKELQVYSPDIICYQMDDLERAKKREDDYMERQKELFKSGEIKSLNERFYSKVNNGFEMLKRMVMSIKGISDYNPSIIIFGEEKMDSKDFKDALTYESIISIKEDMSLDQILSFLEKFKIGIEREEKKKFETVLEKLRKKNYSKYFHLSPMDLKPKKVFLKKYDESSKVYYHHEMILKEINELEMVFESPTSIPLYTTLKIEDPISCFLTTIPMDPHRPWARMRTKGKMNRAFIHVIGEADKKKLRQRINASFYDKG